ncbi:hypothetical protein CDD82_1802 [Ophiocordyceps australis]|uniref:F-box domain-containing protein n=1 Tax=Ophiocordyceps australis TaxID=1399860 RepID=A0A2C5ZKN3_9HYPO|nr:hypothetical protein CDD82_1802 [Ophiocordyceps australis]
MVQVLVDPVSQNATPIHQAEEWKWTFGLVGQGDSATQEDFCQRMKELRTKRSFVRAPRRGWSTTDYQGDHGAGQNAQGGIASIDYQASIPENAVLATHTSRAILSSTADQTVQVPPPRPRLPPPRRSYSVTDKEPELVSPNQPRPSSRMSILDLPSELHYTLFDVLDPIDGVCLGLAHSKLYAIHRRKYGKVPLCSRYSGPNDMEWAWRGAGPLIRPEQQQQQQQQEQQQHGDSHADKSNKLGQLRVKGQVYCRKCGISRCELHRHLRDWMGDGYEYCEIRKMYGSPAGHEAKPYCFMSSPKNPRRCGRHGGKTS